MFRAHHWLSLLLPLSLSCAPDPPTGTAEDGPSDATYQAPPFTAGNGALIVERRDGDTWTPLGELELDQFFRTRELPLGQLQDEATTFRLRRDATTAVHLDAMHLRLATGELVAATDDDKLGAADFDIRHFRNASLVFSTDDAVRAIRITGRIEAPDICKKPFLFPLENGIGELPPNPAFYRYRLDTPEASLDIDGRLDEVRDRSPLFTAFAASGTGHPSDDVIGWVLHDREYLYAALDFTGDNTMDGAEDYAILFVRTPEGVRDFKVSMAERLWGQPGFQYTRAVGYEHKVYELAIPWGALGIDPKSHAEPIEVAFATYGTCAPPCGGCTLPDVEDPNGECCLPSEMDSQGFCCDFGVTNGTCNPPPPMPGPTFDLKVLIHSGWSEHVHDIISATDPSDVWAVGDTHYAEGVGEQATAWNAVTTTTGHTLMATYPVLQAGNSRAFGVNVRGEIAGLSGGNAVAMLVPSGGSFPFGFPYDQDTDPNHVITTGTTNSPPNTIPWTVALPNALATDINDADPPTFVGTQNPYTATAAGFSWTNGGLTILGPLAAGSVSYALGVNDAGSIVGYAKQDIPLKGSFDRAVQWNGGGSPNQLLNLCLHCESRAIEINEQGWVVGWTHVPYLPQRRFLFVLANGNPGPGLVAGENIVTLGPASVVGADLNDVVAINDKNQIVGGIAQKGRAKGFLYLPQPDYNLPAGFYWLDDLIPTIQGGPNDGKSTHQISYGSAISNTGYIVARAWRRDDNDADRDYYVMLRFTENLPAAGVNPVSGAFTSAVTVRERAEEDADPVNTATGEFLLRTEPDLERGRLSFHRYHSSRLETHSVWTELSLGPGWRHAFHWKLQPAAELNPVVTVESPEGTQYPFTDDGTSWQSERPGAQLVTQGSTHRFFLQGTGRALVFDDAGQLVQIDHHDGYSQTLSYASGQLTTVTDVLGQTLTLTYVGDELTTVSDGDRSVSFTYLGSGILGEVIDAEGQATTYLYDVDGQLASIAHPELNEPLVSTYVAGKVSSQLDALGNTTTFDYAATTTTITSPEQRQTVRHYVDGLIDQREDPAGNVTAFSYEDDGTLTSITDAAGRVQSFTYHAASGELASITSPIGGTTAITHVSDDVSGVTVWDVAERAFADGTTETITVDRNAGGTTWTLADGNGATHASVFDTSGQEVATVNGLGGVTDLTYAGGELVEVTTPRQSVIQVSTTYSGAERTRQWSYADGSSWSLTYDGNDRVVETTVTPTGANPSRSKTYTYDANGNVVTTVSYGGDAVGFTYDALDRLQTFTSATGGETSFAYTDDGLLASVTDPNGVTMAITYDLAERLATMVDGHGETWRYDHDAVGRLTEIETPLGSVATIAYDDAMRTQVATSPLGHQTTTQLDALGRPVGILDAQGGWTCFGYDAAGLLASIVLPSEAATTPCADRTNLDPTLAPTVQLISNGLGLVEEVIDPNLASWFSRRDVSGNLSQLEDPLGQITDLTYDDRDRLAAVSHPDGTTEQVTRDPYGLIAERRYSAANEPDEVVSYTRDLEGRVVSSEGLTLGYDAEGDVVESNGIAVTRDAGGRMETVTLAPGKLYTYVYDAERLVQVQDWTGGQVELVYDQDGRRTTILRSNGVTTSLGYDADDHLASIADGTIGSIAISRDDLGRVQSVERTALELVVSASDSGLRSVDAASQLDSQAHDARGRRTSDDTRSYAWLRRGPLSSTTEDGQTVSFDHDAYGALIGRTGAEAQAFTWSYAHPLPCPTVHEVDTTTRYVVCTPEGEVLYSLDEDGADRHFYHFDERGNTSFVTDDAGSVIAAYSYLPYGEIASSIEQEGLHNPFTFSGRWGVIADGDGLYHTHRRVYDARTQRFVSRDPALVQVEPQAVNPYAYAAGDPMSYVDPFGAKPKPVYKDTVAEKAVSNGLDATGTLATAKGYQAQSAANQTFRQAMRFQGRMPPGHNKLTVGRSLTRVDQLNRSAQQANRAGKGLAHLGAVNTAIKGVDDAVSIGDRVERCQALAKQRFDAVNAQLAKLLKNGMSPEKGAELNRAISAELTAELERCYSAAKIDSALTFLEGTKSLVANYSGLPGLVADKALSAGAKALGSDNPFIFVKRDY